jgi:hypothetical protein
LSDPAATATAPNATMIVISQIQRLFVKLCQPFRLPPMLIPPTEELALAPYHLKKNRNMNKAIALPPTILLDRRKRLKSKLIAQFPRESVMSGVIFPSPCLK